MKTILIVGGCGSGKTWVAQQIIAKFGCDELGKIGLFYYHRSKHLAVLGKYDGSTFQGSDRLSMGVMGDAKSFKDQAYWPVTVAEGDRFTNQSFLKLFKPTVVQILDDGKKGRELRASQQTERQIKAKATQVANLVEGYRMVHPVDNSDAALKYVVKLLKAYGI